MHSPFSHFLLYKFKFLPMTDKLELVISLMKANPLIYWLVGYLLTKIFDKILWFLSPKINQKDR